MAAPNRKRTLQEVGKKDESMIDDGDGRLNGMFDDGDDLNSKFQKLKEAYTELQLRCESQQKEWHIQQDRFINEMSRKDKIIQDLRTRLLDSQNRSMTIEDLEEGIDFISHLFAEVFVAMIRNKCLPANEVLNLPRLVSYNNNSWLVDMTTWDACSSTEHETDSENVSAIVRATKVIISLLTKTLKAGRIMLSDGELKIDELNAEDVDAAMVCTMSSFLSFMDPKFVSPLALLVQLTIKAVTGSDVVNRIVGAALPGGVTSKWLHDSIATSVSNFKEETSKDDIDMGTIYVYDNKGKYKLQTYSFGINSCLDQ